MSTKAQQRKQQKRKNRERRIRHDVNIRRNNLPAPAYRLDVFLDGEWRLGVRGFRTWEAVLAHQADTEKRRAAGEEIAEGKIVAIGTGEVKLAIPGSVLKGALPDKLAGNPAADKAVIDNGRILPDNLK
jgi:hypothetical protein